MLRSLRPAWPLLLGLSLLMIANGLLATLLSVRGAELGFGGVTIGLMQAAYPLGALLGAPWAARAIAAVGHVRAFGALASLCSVAAVVHLLSDDPGAWTAMRVLSGLCFPGLYVIAESWLGAAAPPGARATTLSAYFLVQTAGAAAGQFLAGTGARADVLFGATSILISLSLVPLLLSRAAAPPPPEGAATVPATRAWRSLSPMALAGAAINGVAQAAVYVALPLYGLALGLPRAEAAALLVAATLAGGAAQFPVAWLSDRVDRRWAVAALSGAAATAWGALALLPGAGPWTLPLIAAGAAATLPVYAICLAHMADRVPADRLVVANGAMVMALNAGLLAGSFAGPALVSGLGAAAYPAMLSAAALATGAVVLVRRGRRERPAEPGTARPVTAQAAHAPEPWRDPADRSITAPEPRAGD